MIRFLCALAASLLACAALATPIPEPFGSSWGKSVNTDRDCKISRYNGAFTIEMPGGDHDYDPLRKRVNAPRIFRDLECDFDIQVRVRIECRPAAKSAAKGQSPSVSAGFLLIYPGSSRFIYDRMEYGVAQQGIGTDGYAATKSLVHNKQVEATQIWVGTESHSAAKTIIRTEQHKSEFWDLRTNWPLPKKADHVYLRLKHRKGSFYFYISPDGEKWTITDIHLGPPAKLKLGLAAYSTSSEPSKVRFDRLKLIRLK